MKTVHGDLIALALEGNFDVIIHGCNCFNTMGAGIAKTIKQKFPAAYEADLTTTKGDKDKLGTCSWATVATNHGQLTIVNAYTQYQWRGQGKKVDYEALRKAFEVIKTNFSGKRLAYPAIGAGLAGGDWTVIEGIIQEVLQGEDHTYVIYKFK